MIRRQLLRWGLAFAPLSSPAFAQGAVESFPEFAESGTPVLAADVSSGRLSGFGPLSNEENISKPPYQNRFLQYNGLYIWLVRPLDTKGPWRLAQVQISSGGPVAKFNLVPGSTKSDVQTALGKPVQTKNGSWAYFGESTQVQFEFRGSEVRKIVWNLHVD